MCPASGVCANGDICIEFETCDETAQFDRLFEVALVSAIAPLIPLIVIP